jgi:hypothetical protein
LCFLRELKALEAFLLPKTWQVLWAWGISKWTSSETRKVTGKPSSGFNSD